MATYLLFPLLCGIIIYFNRKNLPPFTLPILFIAAYFAVAYLGLPVLYFRLDRGRIFIGAYKQEIIYKLLLISGSVMLAICIITALLAQRRPLAAYNQMRVESASKIQLFAAYALAAVGIITILLFIISAPSIPFFLALKGASTQKLTLARSSATRSSFYPLFKFFGRNLLNFSTYLLFGDYILLRRKNKGRKLDFKDAKKELRKLAAFLLAAFFALLSAVLLNEKAPALYLLLGCSLLYFIVSGRKISFKFIISAAGTALLILAASYFLFMNNREAGGIIRAIFSRAFTGSLAPACLYLEYFPAEIPFLLGSSFPNPGGLLAYEVFPLTSEIKRMSEPHLALKGIKGTSPSAFWCEAYADFSYPGIIIAAILVALILYFTPRILSSRESGGEKINYPKKNHRITLCDAAISAYLSIEFLTLSFAGISAIFAMKLIFFLILACIMRADFKKLRQIEI